MAEIWKCRCGSGKQRYALRDAAGTFCAFVCEQCEPDVRKGYNPAIFRTGTAYAVTGAEHDIGAEIEFDEFDYSEEQAARDLNDGHGYDDVLNAIPEKDLP